MSLKFFQIGNDTSDCALERPAGWDGLKENKKTKENAISYCNNPHRMQQEPQLKWSPQ